MTEQEVKDFAAALAHEYVRVRDEWYEAIDTANAIRAKAQATWDQMYRVCDQLLPSKVREAFVEALLRMERGNRS